MLLNHTQDFAAFDTAPLTRAAPPVAPVMAPRQEISALTHGTLLETPDGWRAVETLTVGQAVYTLDGGFAEIVGLRNRPLGAGPVRHWHVPAGAIGNCSDMRLTSGQHIAMTGPECERLFQTPCVLAPVAAMTGFRGIIATTGFGTPTATELRFAHEEIVLAQTGALLHVPSDDCDPFFRTLGYGETRALVTTLNGGHLALDPAGFAPALAA